MSDYWMISTHGDPLLAVRQLLKDLWQAAGLQGMLLPVYCDGEMASSPRLVEAQEQLSEADPCVPLVPVNAARLVVQEARRHPQKRLAAVLRSCEARALLEISRREQLDLKHWLIIGVDCLASYDEHEFEWRAQKAGSIEQLTRENLGHARQGGIALHRFRPACQMCTDPAAQDVDVFICLLGLPLKQTLLVKAKDRETAGLLQLEHITHGLAEPALVAQYEDMLKILNERRARTMDRMLQQLSADMPDGVDELIAHLESCAPCRECLDACPIYAFEMAAEGNGHTISREAAMRWLLSCASCGMCEQACPNHLPLTAIIRRTSQGLKQEMVLA